MVGRSYFWYDFLVTEMHTHNKTYIQKLQSGSITTYYIIMISNSLYIVSAHILLLELGQGGHSVQ
jgi:hypothetical protein